MAAPDADSPFRMSNGVEVSQNDKREWKHIVLPSNGLRVMIISDPEADMAGAGLAVDIGSFGDPVEIPGLAHFLEHMLFLGTKKYPGENEYSAFLNEHGGGSNAYTAAELTNYHFEVAPEHLRGALDRFSAFFSCPLFTASATSRELQAVDAEHSKNLQSDMWRGYQLDKTTSNPAHPYSHFGTGDSRTLRDIPASEGRDVRAALLAFHAAHYVAPRMRAVVYGREGLETLADWARESFSDIPVEHAGGSSLAVAPPVEGHPYSGVSGLLQHCVPVKDNRTLLVSWAMPSLRHAYGTKPDGYLSHLIGHEGPGSVLSHLKAAGWASGLSAGTFDTESGYSTFSVSVTLTEAGLEAHVDDVIGVIYAYIGLLRSMPPQEWVFSEQAAVASAGFRFKSPSRAFDTVMKTVSDMFEFPPEHTVSGPYLFRSFNGPAVSSLLALMTPLNSRVRVTAKAFAATRCAEREKWYGTAYDSQPLTATQVGAWEASGAPDGAAAARLAPPLHLPQPNEFIATDMAVRFPPAPPAVALAPATGATGEAASPVASLPEGPALREPAPLLLRSNPRSAVWWRGDDHFGAPKLYLQADLLLPLGYDSPLAIVLTDLTARLLKESLNELAYAAEVADLAWNVQASTHGLTLAVGGFSHRLAVLTARIAEKLASLHAAFTDAQFAVQLDKAQREARNFAISQPYLIAAYQASTTLVAPRWHTDEKLEVLEGRGAAALTPLLLRDFLGSGPRGLLSRCFVRALVAGNADRGEALAVADALCGPLVGGGSLPLFPSQLLSMASRVVALPLPITLAPAGGNGPAVQVTWTHLYRQPARNPSETNAAMDMHLQIGPRGLGAAACPSTTLSVLLDLAAHTLSEPFFDELRTKQALGYIVSASVKHEGHVDALRFIVQSNKVAAGELVARTEGFLSSWAGPGGQLESMSPEKFAANVAAVVAHKLESDKSAKDESERLWGEVREGSLHFTRSSVEIEALRALGSGDLLAFVRRYVVPGGAGRRAFVSLVDAAVAAAEGGAPAAAAVMVEEGEEGEEEDSAAAEAAAAPLAPPAGHGVVQEDVLVPHAPVSSPATEAPPASLYSPSPAAALGPASIPLSLQQATALQLELEDGLRLSSLQAGAGTAPWDPRSTLLGAVGRCCGPDVQQAVGTALDAAGKEAAHPAHVCFTVAVASHHALRDALPRFPNAAALRAAVVAVAQ